MQAVHILGGIQRVKNACLVGVVRERKLHQNPVHLVPPVKFLHGGQRLPTIAGSLQTDQLRVDPHFATSLDLVADINLGGEVFARQDHGEPRPGHSPGTEIGDARGHLKPDRLGHRFPIQHARRHAT